YRRASRAGATTAACRRCDARGDRPAPRWSWPEFRRSFAAAPDRSIAGAPSGASAGEKLAARLLGGQSLWLSDHSHEHAALSEPRRGPAGVGDRHGVDHAVALLGVVDAEA